MNVLIACEESQRVCKEFRARGHNAYSADLQRCSGGHPEWHICGDVTWLLDGRCSFRTQDGILRDCVKDKRWDLIIAHPPCTYLTLCGTRHYSVKATPEDKVRARIIERSKAVTLFMTFANANCEKIAIENPMGYMTRYWRKPDQYIDPYMFAGSLLDVENYVTKRTGLWLKNLPPLLGGDLPKPKPFGRYINCHGKSKTITWEMFVTGATQKDRAKARSKTFPGIAKAMAEQWG